MDNAPTIRPVLGKKNLAHIVADQLGVGIVLGTYRSQMPLPNEIQLGVQFGVSRATIRAAVKMLCAQGLLELRRPQSASVQPESMWNMLDPDVLGWLLQRQFSPALILQFTEFRLAIEPRAAYCAATSAGVPEKAAIRLAVARIHSAAWGDDDPLESNIAFHVALLRASGNTFFRQLTPCIATALRIRFPAAKRLKNTRLEHVVRFKKVANAVVARKPNAAAAAMRDLVQGELDLLARHRCDAHRSATVRGNRNAANSTPRALLAAIRQ